MSHRTRHVIDVGTGYATFTVHAVGDFDYNLLCERFEAACDAADAPKQDEAPKPTVHEHDWVLTGIIEAHRPDETIHTLLSCKCGALHWEPTHQQVRWYSLPDSKTIWRGEGYMAPASRYVNWRMPSEGI